MADHGTVEYATATGNDYKTHEASYESFVHFTLVGILYVVTILFGLAVGGVMGHWFTAALRPKGSASAQTRSRHACAAR